jgi:glycosyltransferase involved in cell wall biosynthesis
MPEVSVVMPVFNSMRYLSRIVPPLLAEGRRRGDVEFIFIDNGSTDGSFEQLKDLGPDTKLFSLPGQSIGALRNFGARQARGRYISFVDADCEIVPFYFDAALEELRTSGASATGDVYDTSPNPGWIEGAWHDLHYLENARDVEYLNAGNLFIDVVAFNGVSGFREELVTGEDAELGQRLNAAGHRIRTNPAVRAIHLGNPKSLRHFFRRQVWHGIGMFGTVQWHSIDKPSAVMLVHIGATAAGVIVIATMPWSLVDRFVVAAAFQLLAPGLTVAFRLVRQRRLSSILPGLFLYWLYYWARVQALLVIALGKGRRYRK